MSRPIFFCTFLCLSIIVEGEWKYIAVVEYHAIDNPKFTPEERLNRNADEYINILAHLSKSHNITVIVFPEATLDNVKTEKDFPSYGVNLSHLEEPCFTHRKYYPVYLQKLSCAAKKYGTRIIFNLIETLGYHFYSSDVILNPTGAIELSLARENRIGVPDLHNDPIPFVIPPRKPFYYEEIAFPSLASRYFFILTSFVTGFSFSAEKAIFFTAFRNYIVCSNWISQLPFLTSFQVYQMWAQEFEISIFFSSINNPKRGQGGTGVYHVTGPVLMDIVSSGGTRAYVYNFSSDLQPGQITNPLPNKSMNKIAKEMDSFYLETDPDLHRYESRILNPTQESSVITLCYNKTESNYFCCQFSLHLSFKSSLQGKNQYVYHMVAYKGYKTYYDIFEPGGVEVCAIIACLNSSLTSCGRRFDNYEDIVWPITFEKIVVKARFNLPLREKIYLNSQFPNSLLSSIRPIHPNFTDWKEDIVTEAENISYLEKTFTLTHPQNEILTFGIFGRNFTITDIRSRTNKIYFNPVFIFWNICVFIFL